MNVLFSKTVKTKLFYECLKLKVRNQQNQDSGRIDLRALFCLSNLEWKTFQ